MSYRPGRLAQAIALGIFLSVLLDIACHELWYRCLPGELLQYFHLGVFGSRFSGEWAHPEVPKAEDFPFWSAPAVALSALGMSAVLRRSMAQSIFMSGGLVFAWFVFWENPGEYEWSALRIHSVWAIAAAIGAAVPPLLRWRRVRVEPSDP